MSEEQVTPEPASQPEEQHEEQQPDVTRDPRFEQAVQERVRQMLSTQAEPQAPSGNINKAIAQLQEGGDLGQFILGVANMAAQAEERAKKAEDLARNQRVIPVEALADAEREFESGRHQTLLDAYYADQGRKLVEGKVKPAPPAPRPVQTVVRTVPTQPQVTELSEMTASQWKEALKGPQAAEIRQRYRTGKLTVVPG